MAPPLHEGVSFKDTQTLEGYRPITLRRQGMTRTEEKKMNVLAELSIFPMDKGVSLAAYVARAVRIIRESGLDHQFGPMSTVVEGDWDQVMEVVGRCQKNLAADCDRILVYLRLDCRRGRKNAIREKVRSVETRLD